jgi:hypothetical protein
MSTDLDSCPSSPSHSSPSKLFPTLPVLFPGGLFEPSCILSLPSAGFQQTKQPPACMSWSRPPSLGWMTKRAQHPSFLSASMLQGPQKGTTRTYSSQSGRWHRFPFPPSFWPSLNPSARRPPALLNPTVLPLCAGTRSALCQRCLFLSPPHSPCSLSLWALLPTDHISDT